MSESIESPNTSRPSPPSVDGARDASTLRGRRIVRWWVVDVELVPAVIMRHFGALGPLQSSLSAEAG